MPEVLHMRTKGVRIKLDKGDWSLIYVGRPSKWGNPFEIGRDGTREEVVDKYDDYLYTRPDLLAVAKEELGGKDLVCWCAPEMCHADILLELANN